MANNFTADITVLEARLTAARAGYLDNLSAGAVALATNLTAARAGYLDNLSAGAVALDSKMDIVDTNLDTLLTRLSAARAGYLDNLDDPFNSIQDSVISIAGSSGNASATISSVDTSKSILINLGFTAATAGMQANEDLCYLTLVNATTVTAWRYTAAAAAMLCSFTIVEWK